MCTIYQHRKCFVTELKASPGMFLLKAKRKVYIVSKEELTMTFEVKNK
jgi:hypothetical protein